MGQFQTATRIYFLSPFVIIFRWLRKLTNWISDSGAMCHMTPEVSDFIPGSLKDTDKHIEVSDGYHVMSKKRGKFRIKMCDNNRDLSTATKYNVLLEPYLCDRLV